MRRNHAQHGHGMPWTQWTHGHQKDAKSFKKMCNALLFDLFDLFALQCIAHCFWALHLGEPTGKQ